MPREQQIGYRLYVRDEATGKLVALKDLLVSIGNQGDRSSTKINRGFSKADSSASQLNRTLGRLQRTLVAIAGVWVAREMIRGLESLVKAGVEFNKSIEQTRIGIAAVLAAQTKLIDSTGRELESREKIIAAQKIATKIQQDLLVANLKTAATYQQLVLMFQQALPHALREGFNIKQIEEFVTAMSQAATAMGIPLNMMAEEMRSMLKGTITMKNTLIAVALGMDKNVIKSLQGSGKKLFDYLMTYLRAFQASSDDIMKSWEGMLTNMKQAFSMTMGDAFQDFYIEGKRAMSRLIDYFRSEEFRRVASTWAEFLTAGLKRAPEAIEKITKGIAKIIDFTKQHAEAVKGAGLVGALLFGGAPMKVLGLGLYMMDKVNTFMKTTSSVEANLTTRITALQAKLNTAKRIVEEFETSVHPKGGAKYGSAYYEAKHNVEVYSRQLALLKQTLEDLRSEKYLLERIEAIRRKVKQDESKEAKDKLAQIVSTVQQLSDEEKEYEDHMKRVIGLIKEAVSAREEDYSKRLQFWEKETASMKDAQDAIDTYFTRQYLKSVEEVTETSSDRFNTLVDLAQHTAERMQDAFSDFFFDVMRGNFKDFGDYISGFLTSIQRAIADVLGQMFVRQVIPAAGEWLGGQLMGGGLFFHRGGIVGETPAPMRSVPATLFAHAPKLHSGLGADEFPAILQRGETVLPKGVAPAQTTNITIYAVDSQSFADAIRRNRAVVVGASIEDVRSNGQLLQTLRGVL